MGPTNTSSTMLTSTAKPIYPYKNQQQNASFAKIAPPADTISQFLQVCPPCACTNAYQQTETQKWPCPSLRTISAFQKRNQCQESPYRHRSMLHKKDGLLFKNEPHWKHSLEYAAKTIKASRDGTLNARMHLRMCSRAVCRSGSCHKCDPVPLPHKFKHQR